MFRDWFLADILPQLAPSSFDKRIYEKLQLLEPTVATKYLTAWSIHLQRFENYSGAVSEMRDVLTLALHLLAPNSAVESEANYQREQNSSGPTRRQRINFIARQRSMKPAELQADIEMFEVQSQQLAKIVNISYSHASARTHTTASNEQAWRCLKQLDSVLAQIL
jgi:hypothetical protein